MEYDDSSSYKSSSSEVSSTTGELERLKNKLVLLRKKLADGTCSSSSSSDDDSIEINGIATPLPRKPSNKNASNDNGVDRNISRALPKPISTVQQALKSIKLPSDDKHSSAAVQGPQPTATVTMNHVQEIKPVSNLGLSSSLGSSCSTSSSSSSSSSSMGDVDYGLLLSKDAAQKEASSKPNPQNHQSKSTPANLYQKSATKPPSAAAAASITVTTPESNAICNPYKALASKQTKPAPFLDRRTESTPPKNNATSFVYDSQLSDDDLLTLFDDDDDKYANDEHQAIADEEIQHQQARIEARTSPADQNCNFVEADPNPNGDKVDVAGAGEINHVHTATAEIKASSHVSAPEPSSHVVSQKSIEVIGVVQERNAAQAVDEANIAPKPPSPKSRSVIPQDKMITKMPLLSVTDTRNPFEHSSEIHHSFYAPPVYRPRPPPRLLSFSERNRPKENRPHIPLTQVFASPINKLWDGKFDQFNPMQSELVNLICHSDDHTVVSAPTGAGKTALFEMAMARLFTLDLQGQGHTSAKADGRTGQKQRISRHFKTVYVSPSKALCEERFDDWSKRCANLDLGIQVTVITGDGDGEAFRDLAAAHLILTTPEKWDSMTRNWTSRYYLFASVKLFLLDEVHLLGDDSRGATLESIIVRMKTIQRTLKSVPFCPDHLRASSYPHTTPEAISACMRMVAVSATLPNLQDVSELIGANEAYEFDSSYRPVPLDVHVWGAGIKGKNEFYFWNSLDRCVLDIIHKFSGGKQTLIFCHTKKECERLASFLAGGGQNNPHLFNKKAQSVRSLNECMSKKVAYHHAGLDSQTRKVIESDFSKGRLLWLCATSTLSMGVNLPARLVVVKGTMTWRGGTSGYQDIDPGTILQMIGRAGRPGLDTKGVAMIITDNQSRDRIERIASGLGPVKSQLLPKVIDTINVGISQRVIINLETCIRWIQTTLLFIHLRQKHGDAVNEQVSQICQSALDFLTGIKAIRSGEHGDNLVVQPAAYIMSQRMIPSEAMKSMSSLQCDATLCQLLHVLVKNESIEFPVRRHEKKLLNEKHKELRFKIADGPLSKMRVKVPWEKSFILLQCFIAQIEFSDFTLAQEMTTICNSAVQMLEATVQYSVHASKHGHVAYHCLCLTRAISTCVWGEKGNTLYQFQIVDQEKANKLRFNGICTFQDVVTSSDAKIGKAVGLGANFGRELRFLVVNALRDKLRIVAKVERTKETNQPADIHCDIVPDSDIHNDPTVAMIPKRSSETHYTVLVYTDQPGGCLFFQDDLTGPHSFRFECPPTFEKLYVRLISSLVGLDDVFELTRNASPDSGKTPKKLPLEERARRCARQSDIRKSMTQPADQKAKGAAQRRSFPASTAQKGKSSEKATVLRQAEHGYCSNSKTESSPPNRRRQPDIRPRRLSLTPTRVGQDTSLQKQETDGMTGEQIPLGISRQEDKADRIQGSVAKQLPAQQGPTQLYQVSQTQSTHSARSGVTPARNSFQWKRAKAVAQTQQKRAFASKKDNPFTSYKHDPNDAEGFLDCLSSDDANQSSIIPTTEIKLSQRPALTQATPRQMPSRSFSRFARGSIKRKRDSARVSAPELLRQKAAEHGSYQMQSQSSFNVRAGPTNQASNFTVPPVQPQPYAQNYLPPSSMGRYRSHYVQAPPQSSWRSQCPSSSQPGTISYGHDYGHGHGYQHMVQQQQQQQQPPFSQPSLFLQTPPRNQYPSQFSGLHNQFAQVYHNVGDTHAGMPSYETPGYGHQMSIPSQVYAWDANPYSVSPLPVVAGAPPARSPGYGPPGFPQDLTSQENSSGLYQPTQNSSLGDDSFRDLFM